VGKIAVPGLIISHGGVLRFCPRGPRLETRQRGP
jgi:hypothetical protein